MTISKQELKQEKFISEILGYVKLSDRPFITTVINEILELERELTLLEEDPNQHGKETSKIRGLYW